MKMRMTDFAVPARPAAPARAPHWRGWAVALLIALISVAGVGRAAAQMAAADRQMGVRYIDIRAGLPKNVVSDMLLDSHGFVWISTGGGGLVRYDGYQMRHVPDGSDGSNASRKMAEDDYGRLWVAYGEHSSVISLRTLQQTMPETLGIDLANVLSQRAVYMLRDSLHRMWVVTSTHINLLTFDQQGRVTELAQCTYTNNNPSTVLSDVMGDGNVWANIDGGVFRLEKKGKQLVKKSISPVLDRLRGLYVPAMMQWKGKIWLATNDGLFCYNPQNHNLQSYQHSAAATSLSHNYCTALTVSHEEWLVVGTLAGVDMLTGDDGTFAHWNSSTPTTPLSSDFVSCFLSVNQQLWVGTENGGIVHIAPRQLLLSNYCHSDDPASLPTNLVNAMHAEPDGSLWVGTVEGGLSLLKPGAQGFIRFNTANSALPHNTVSTLTADRKGRLWIGTWGGGVSYMDLRDEPRIVPVKANDNYRELIQHVGALAFDERNNGLWIGCNAGLFFYDLNSHTVVDPFEGNRDIRGCIGAIITHDEHLWMGCVFGMRDIDLHRRKDGSFSVRALTYRPDKPQGKVVDHITSFCEASDGTLWMGSDSYGLYHRTIDAKGQEHFEALNTSDGLPNNGVKGVVVDSQQRLWVTTDNGLAVYVPSTRTFTILNENDGLLSPEFYWNSIITQGGKLYLGSRAGLTIIDGERKRLHRNSHLCFTALTVDNRPIGADGKHLDCDITSARKLTLHESERSVAIRFSTLSYALSEPGTYSYRLRGLSDKWTVLPAGENGVNFTGLRAGNYTLQLRYTSAIGQEPELKAELQIVVKPYFYNSWWFRMIVILVALAVAAWAYKRRVRHLVSNEAERQLAPIRKELEESDNPEQFRNRIAHILNNEETLRGSLKKSVAEDQKKAAKGRKPFLDRVTKIMEQNYMNPDFGIDEFCAAIGMSRSQVNKRLNQETGVPLGQFIKNYRLSIAQQILLQDETNRNITEIAYSVGFNDPKYFTRCFTKLYGANPKGYGRTADAESDDDTGAPER